MAIDFGDIAAQLPVRLQLGDGDLVEVGLVTITSITSNGETIVDKRPIAALLRAVADEIEHPSEDGSAAT